MKGGFLENARMVILSIERFPIQNENKILNGIILTA